MTLYSVNGGETSSTYVASITPIVDQFGKLAWNRVSLASGHVLTMQPEDSPALGDQCEIRVRFTGQPVLPGVVG